MPGDWILENRPPDQSLSNGLHFASESGLLIELSSNNNQQVPKGRIAFRSSRSRHNSGICIRTPRRLQSNGVHWLSMGISL
eukprot:7900421-Pyramimonas_sp.AAC.1